MTDGDKSTKFKPAQFSLSLIPLILYFIVVLLSFAWPILSPTVIDAHYSLPSPDQKAPSLSHPLGLDDLGMDVMGNVLSGFRTSFVSGFLATFLFLVFGLGLGLLIGFEDKAGSSIATGIASTLNSIPKFFALFLAFMISGRYSPFMLMSLLGILSAPRLAEILKFKISQYRKEDFYDAAIALGLSPAKVIGKHIIWYNARKSIFSEISYMFGYAILSEATLSFILHGTMGPGWKSWGDIINQELTSFSVLVYDLFNPAGEGSIWGNNPLKFLAPLIALILTVMLFTILSRRLSSEVD
jgi:ABC-type dipeptide/oligopeptide/nickel transport system permease subunit